MTQVQAKVEEETWQQAQKELPKSALDETLEWLNSLHAVINSVGSKTVIASWEPSDLDPQRLKITYQHQSDFNLRYSNRTVTIPIVIANGTKTIDMPLSKWWLGHKDRKQYSSVAFLPTQPSVVNNCLNLWQCWGVEDVEGDWSLIRNHIQEVIADGDPVIAEYILRWMAWAIQNPGRQAEVALVFIGEKGAGKGTVARVLQRIFGIHSYQVTGADELTGEFNDHLQDTILLVADEAIWGGDRKGLGRLQSMITEPTISIHPKGLKRFQVRNLLHVVMLSEPGWVVPAGRHERRYAPVLVSAGHLRDEAYFDDLHKQINSDGAAGMFHDLKRMELGGWHPRKIPDEILFGSALRQQQERTLPPLERWYMRLLHDGRLPASTGRFPNRALTSPMIEDAKSKYPRLRLDLTEVALRDFLVESMNRIGISCDKFRTGSANGWAFPPLSECREAWMQIYGPTEWDTEVEEWFSAELHKEPSLRSGPTATKLGPDAVAKLFAVPLREEPPKRAYIKRRL